MSHSSRRLWAGMLVLGLLFIPRAFATAGNSWTGVLRDEAGNPVASARVRLHSLSTDEGYAATTTSEGKFTFINVVPGSYEISVTVGQNSYPASAAIIMENGRALVDDLSLSGRPKEVRVVPPEHDAGPQASGGEHLSSSEVSSLPLNSRDFSKLLLLAAGTMTDANGAANFTQQFAVNGQRGTATVFAMDGADTTDPEMGGATFSNFNVDAIQEVQSNTGVMPAEIGHGAASYTNVVTKSGTDQIHGSMFEFARNAAFDARNYFDHNAPGSRRRIPPFVRNEFGFTNGGPVVLPGIYDGRNRTFYF